MGDLGGCSIERGGYEGFTQLYMYICMSANVVSLYFMGCGIGVWLRAWCVLVQHPRYDLELPN